MGVHRHSSHVCSHQSMAIATGPQHVRKGGCVRWGRSEKFSTPNNRPRAVQPSANSYMGLHSHHEHLRPMPIGFFRNRIFAQSDAGDICMVVDVFSDGAEDNVCMLEDDAKY